MKIKRLTIRNIASIEKGDIDFETGLTDNESGKPASLFLITGDTGSGKSVILDCISMALYGTTPRVKSVNGVKNNTYRNNDGEEISVNDITQYTRIGISSRDDCFSELVFTGNDNVDYTAKFSLGRTNRGNYRKPEWVLTIGNTEIIENRKEEIRIRIEKAVGLTFEQFSRMAMLAQGQFATFLTGKKEERERILEQLTDTGIFSRYGDAISLIYKKAKQDYETGRKIYEEFKKKILDDSARETLLSEQSEKMVLADTVRKEMERIRQRIQCSVAIKKALEDIRALKIEATKLLSIEDTPEFLKDRKLLELWDKTTNQRELLSDKIKTSDKLIVDKKTIQDKKSEFLFLTADLSDRLQILENKTIFLEEQKNWIERRNSFKSLFVESSVVISDINRFLSSGKDIAEKEKEYSKVKIEIENLNKRSSILKEDSANKRKCCKECQDLINQKSKAREEMNPTLLRKDKETMIKQDSALNDLLTRISANEIEKKDVENIKNEVDRLAKLLSELQVSYDKALEESRLREKEKDSAESRYKTMLLSVEEKFVVLRKKLVDTHASNCPLCGQSIDNHLKEWSNEDYFSEILSPLEEEKKICTKLFNDAKKKADNTKEQMNTYSGSLKAKEEDLKKRERRLVDNEEVIKAKIESLGLEESDNLKDIIADKISVLKIDIDGISKKLEETDILQKEIDSLLAQKQSLDLAYQAADKALQESLNTLVKKQQEFKQISERITELNMEKDSLQRKISSALKDYAKEWYSNPSEIAKLLKKDASEYSEKVSSYAKEESEHRAQLQTIDSIITIRDNISDILESIEPSEELIVFGNVKFLKIKNLQERWHNFHIEVSAIDRRISEQESKIIEINQNLEVYYQSNGITETTLLHLLKAAKEIPEKRICQENHRSEIKKNSTLISESEKIKDENLKLLKLEDESQLEDTDKLKIDLDSLTKQSSELIQRLGAIKEKIETDEKTCNESKKQKDELEQLTLRMEKWEKMNKYFGGTKFRTLVQSHILRPLLHNANIYLRQITDHYTLTCSDENEQLSILVRDRYHNNELRSITVLSGGERFMVSLALSLALSAMNRPDLNVDILFIDEGFGTLDAKSLDMVMSTLRRLPEINGQSGRRVGVISHREELTEQIDCQIRLRSYGEGRSRIEIKS